MVMMPPAGAAVRANDSPRSSAWRTSGSSTGESVSSWTSSASSRASLAYDSDDASLIRVTRRDWEKARRIPAALAGEMTKAASEGMEAWVAARAANDYDAFRPWLDRHLELKRRLIDCFEPTDEPYDILLDDFEPGHPTAEVRAVFDRLKEELCR